MTTPPKKCRGASFDPFPSLLSFRSFSSFPLLPPKPQTEEGFVLVCVLWVLAILTVITLGMGHRTQLDRRASANALDQAQAMMMARGCVQRGIVEIRNKAFMDALDPATAGCTHLGQSWAQPMDLLETSGYFDNKDLKGDHAWFDIIDEDRYVNINACDEKFLNSIKALDRSTQRKIWERRTKGEWQGEPSAPFQTIEELRYLRGVKDDDWFGDDKHAGIKDVVTTFGSNQININTAPREVLESVPEMKGALVDGILAYRAGPDHELGTRDDIGFKSIGEISEKLAAGESVTELLRSYCKTNSSFFKVTGNATRRGGTVRAECSAVVQIQNGEATVLSWREETIGV